jgi:hypothetical protein
MRDDLSNILKRVDEAMRSPRIDGQLAGKVRRRAQNERVARTVLTAAVIVGLGLLAIQFAPRGGRLTESGRPIIATNTPARELGGNVDQLVGEILVKHELAKHSTQLSAGGDDYLWRLSQERNRAALILVRSGDRLYEELHDRPAAEANYRLAIQLFPNSPSAAEAQERLQKIDRKGNSI